MLKIGVGFNSMTKHSLGYKRSLVLVTVLLEWTLDGHINIIGLSISEACQHATETFHHEEGDFLIKVFRQDFYCQVGLLQLCGQIGVFAIEEIHLRQNLVCKRTIHDT